MLSIMLSLLICNATHASEEGKVFTIESTSATYQYEPRKRILTATCDDKSLNLKIFRPLLAVPGEDEPARRNTIFLEEAIQNKGVLDCTYTAIANDAVAVNFRVKLSAIDDSLIIEFSANNQSIRGMASPKLATDGEWRRLDVSQYGLAYGQPWYQKATYAEGLWCWAFWTLEEGNASEWKATDALNAGEGNVCLAPDAIYLPNTEDQYQPLREKFSLRISDRLWDAVPPLPNPPSPYREELAESVFIDMWGTRPAEERLHFLKTLAEVTCGYTKCYTVLQNWQAAGFDALLPDSIRMPDYPPNPTVGTVKELEKICSAGKRLGRFAFRTNYQLLRDNAPSAIEGSARPALKEDASANWHTKQHDLTRLAVRQEMEIANLFGSNAPFTDQLSSGGPASAFLDFDPSIESGNTMREIAKAQRSFAEYLQMKYDGPLGSEKLNAEYLLGRWVATGDFSVIEGHNRLVSPDYKLRRIHQLSMFHGMGLMYRFFEMPPFHNFHKGKRKWETDQELHDSYRCMEVLFGNGGYVFAPHVPWDYVLTECLLIGRLQQHYALQPVSEIYYQQDDEWLTLEQLVRNGFRMNTEPWLPKNEEFGRVRVEYANGLTVVANRLGEPLPVDVEEGKQIVLPKHGWVAWSPEILAYSAHYPGSEHRIDYLLEKDSGLKFINPREQVVEGVDKITLFEKDEIIMQADVAKGTATVNGKSLSLHLPRPASAKKLEFDFTKGKQGWKPEYGILTEKETKDGWELHLATSGPYLISPPLSLNADDIEEIIISMRVTKGNWGKLYFMTESDPRISEDQTIYFKFQPSDSIQTIRICPSQHSRWNGQTITGFRFDPVKDAPGTNVLLVGIH